jgi:hypothetical protein
MLTKLAVLVGKRPSLPDLTICPWVWSFSSLHRPLAIRLRLQTNALAISISFSNVWAIGITIQLFNVLFFAFLCSPSQSWIWIMLSVFWDRGLGR